MFNLTIMNLRRFLAIAVLSLLSFQGYASHLLGGEIVWKCKPNGKYQFTLVVYRDCGGISLPTSAQSLAISWINLVLKEHFIVRVIRRVYITELKNGVQSQKMDTNSEIILYFIHAMVRSLTG